MGKGSKILKKILNKRAKKFSIKGPKGPNSRSTRVLIHFLYPNFTSINITAQVVAPNERFLYPELSMHMGTLLLLYILTLCLACPKILAVCLILNLIRHLQTHQL